MIKYEDIIVDKIHRRRHNNIIHLICENEVDDKVLLIRELEQTFGIQHLDVKFNDINQKETCEMDDTLFRKIVKRFDTQKKKPTNYHQLLQLYVNMLKHLSPDIVITKKSRKKLTRNMAEYTFNNEVAQYHLKLYEYRKS